MANDNESGHNQIPHEKTSASPTLELRGQHIMPSTYLAKIFDVETRLITQNIKNNPEIFSEKYAFEVTENEREILTSLGVIPKPGRGGSRALPWVVTQKGALRLATLMKSKKAIEATDIIVDIFTEVMRQLYAGQESIIISQPSRLLPNLEVKQNLNELRTNIAEAMKELLNFVVDPRKDTTLGQELGEIALSTRDNLNAWLSSKQISNEKVEAETLILIEQARDLFERRQSDLKGAAIEHEKERLELAFRKMDLLERMIEMHDKMEPNAIIGVAGAFETSKPLPLPDTNEK